MQGCPASTFSSCRSPCYSPILHGYVPFQSSPRVENAILIVYPPPPSPTAKDFTWHSLSWNNEHKGSLVSGALSKRLCTELADKSHVTKQSPFPKHGETNDLPREAVSPTHPLADCVAVSIATAHAKLQPFHEQQSQIQRPTWLLPAWLSDLLKVLHHSPAL